MHVEHERKYRRSHGNVAASIASTPSARRKLTIPPREPHAVSAARTLVPISSSLPFATLDDHRVILRLGQGGMAEVFLAARPEPGSRELVVIKRLHGSDEDDDPALERMLRDEARIAVRLAHPNIVKTFGIGTLAGRHAIVMEFLEGQPLQKVLRRLAEHGERVPLEVFVPLFADALDGLHYAHESKADDGQSLGVIHRDVSPHNLFLTSDGVLKLLDFGIAKTALQEDRTRTGLLKGKVSYMAPEQALGENVDRRADIWSMGVVFWETLAGTRLFKADNEAASLRLTLMGEVRTLSSVRTELPAALDAIVARALERDPKARYATAAQMAAALRTFCVEHGISNLTNGKALMSSLFEAEFTELRRRIAFFFANGNVLTLPQHDSMPSSGTMPLRMLPADSLAARPLPADLAAASAIPDSGGGTKVSAVNEFANELERHQRRSLRMLALAFVPIVVALLLLGFVVLNRAPAQPQTSAPTVVPQVMPDPPSSTGTAVAPSAPVATATAVEVDAPVAPSSTPDAKAAPPAPAARRTGEPAPLAPAPTLSPAPAPAAEFGYLTLDTSPWANVSIGGTSLGQTPVVRAKLPAGTHMVVLSNPERGISTTYQVTIQPGKTSVRRLGLD